LVTIPLARVAVDVSSAPDEDLSAEIFAPTRTTIVSVAPRVRGVADQELRHGDEVLLNVDPSSTMQVVNQLIKHSKDFDLLVVPGGEHGAGRSGETGPYGERKRFDVFLCHLSG
jgi:hypothetical protein